MAVAVRRCAFISRVVWSSACSCLTGTVPLSGPDCPSLGSRARSVNAVRWSPPRGSVEGPSLTIGGDSGRKCPPGTAPLLTVVPVNVPGRWAIRGAVGRGSYCSHRLPPAFAPSRGRLRLLRYPRPAHRSRRHSLALSPLTDACRGFHSMVRRDERVEPAQFHFSTTGRIFYGQRLPQTEQ